MTNKTVALPPWRLGLAHQRHPHVAHPPALAADAAHPLLEVVLEWLRVRLQRRAPGGALGGHGGDDLEYFLGGVRQRRGLIDAWAPRLTRPGVDDQVRRADETCLQRCCGRDGQPLLQQRVVDPTAKLGEHFRAPKRLL